MRFWIRILPFVIPLSLLLGITSQSDSYADQCLSQFPDSAWVSGQPASVNQLLNQNLILADVRANNAIDGTALSIQVDPNFKLDTFYLRGDLIFYSLTSGYPETTIPVNITYLYKGLNCGDRSVNVLGKATYKEVTEVPASDGNLIYSALQDAYQNVNLNGRTYNFQDLQNLRDEYLEVNKILSITQTNPILLKRINWSNLFTLGLGPLISKYYYGANNAVPISLPTVTSDDGCVNAQGSQEGFGYPDSANQRSLDGAFAFRSHGSTCELTAHFHLGTQLSNINQYHNPVNQQYQILIHFWVKDSSNVSSTVTCTKGKQIKRIYGNNPKCPTGWKIKV
jgi:hypothetical protein